MTSAPPNPEPSKAAKASKATKATKAAKASKATKAAKPAKASKAAAPLRPVAAGVAPKTTAIDLVISDHRSVETLFQQYEADPTAADVQGVVQRIILELVQHSEAEEMYLYPAARKVLANGDRVIEHDIDEHSRAERIMNSLDGMEAANRDFDPLVRLLISEIRQHVSEEEGIMLPQLRNALTEDDLVELGGKLQLAKKIAPTHPHPSAPDHPPFNKVMGAAPALVDRVRDFLRSS